MSKRTSKKILTSQSERDMTRNRDNRRLIAMLDDVELKIPKRVEVTLCPHIKYCHIKYCHIVKNKYCLFGEGYVRCRVARFYDKNLNYRETNDRRL